MSRSESTGGNAARAAHALRRSFAGDVILPGDAAYGDARLGWNRAIDARPAIVAQAAGAHDVQAAVRAAREQGWSLAVQATGHGTVLPADGGLLISTSRMAEVQVEPERSVARVGPGALWQQVIAAAAPFGLAPLSGRAPTIGVTGYTLGGGTGWLSRKYGFAADSLLDAEVVTADGAQRVASADEHPDLFWALRGGGGNFGVVTSLRFRLYPATRVYGGMSLYPLDRAWETLARYRDWALDEPDQLNTAVLLLRLPAVPEVPEPLRDTTVLAVRIFGVGMTAADRRLFDPLLAAAGPPLLDGVKERDFAGASAATSGPPPPAMAARLYIDLFREVPDAVLDGMVAAAGAGPLAFVELRHWGGAMARPAPDAGPVGHRDVPFSVTALAPYDEDRDGAEAAVDELAARLQPHATGGSFLNFLMDPTKTRTAYAAADYRRLTSAKRAWDPDNFFHLNHNIPPS